MYAIIDIETTGLSPLKNRITEIAIFIHDGNRIVREFSTLINPECYITANITKLTGITNEMVAQAPRFWEVAKDIVLLTEGRIFVAHNASFDYNFIRQEFKSLGYDFKREKLCTVQLSRRIIPKQKSYSLGKLCDVLNIPINARHRAAGDALATVKLFEYLLNTDSSLAGLKSGKFYNLKPSLIKKLPDETGVYYFHNEQGDIIYIGKSKNIRTRVFSHFNNEKTSRALKMMDETFDISYEITGSDLIAQLFESNEIKTHKPKYNRKQRRKSDHVGIYSSFDNHGYICFSVEKIGEHVPLIAFNSVKEARERLYYLSEKYELCQKLCGLYHTAGACFYHQLKQCKGACVQQEPVKDYNIRANKLIQNLSYNHQSFFIIDKGRTREEKSLVKVENGTYIGHGFIPLEWLSSGIENFSDFIKEYPDHRDTQQIIRAFIKQHSVEKIIPF
ncbi:MAG: exonuclease domain-containing protein [Bacteroidales bacterium]|jgi:DNA polymerase-3 subunit epsilon|nr:exonuclease domain-containing protein [Bacteroidales bacterium]